MITAKLKMLPESNKYECWDRPRVFICNQTQNIIKVITFNYLNTVFNIFSDLEKIYQYGFKRYYIFTIDGKEYRLSASEQKALFNTLSQFIDDYVEVNGIDTLDVEEV